MTSLIAQFLSPFLPWIIAAVTVLAGGWGYGRAKERKGRKEAEAKAAAQKAKDNAATVERVLNETPSVDPADHIRQRLRDRANRKP